MRMRGQGALVPTGPKKLPTTKEQLVVELVIYLVKEYGVDVADWVWDKLTSSPDSPVTKTTLEELRKQIEAKKKSSSSGGMLLLLALAFASSGRKR